jgi:hypothetical protein
MREYAFNDLRLLDARKLAANADLLIVEDSDITERRVRPLRSVRLQSHRAA